MTYFTLNHTQIHLRSAPRYWALPLRNAWYSKTPISALLPRNAGMSVVDVKAKTFDELRQYLLPDG
jgi:hypothetical protein